MLFAFSTTFRCYSNRTRIVSWLTRISSCSVFSSRYYEEKRENIKLTDKERYDIGKSSSVHGATAAVRKFKKSYPHLKLGESTARSLKKKYEELLKSKSKKTELTKLKRGRPVMLGSIDEKVKNFLLILRQKGGVVNSVVAIVAVQALIQKSSDEHLKCIDLVSSSWTQCLF